jgi:hypothetical protein
MMKKSILCALFLGIASSAAMVDDKVPVLSKERIRAKAQSLHLFVKQRAPLATAWSVAKAGMAGIGAFYLARFVFEEARRLVSSETVPVSSEVLVPMVTLGELELWKNRIGGFVLSTIGTLGLSYVFGNIEKSYGAPITLSWFVTKRAPFYVTIRCLHALENEEGSSLDASEQTMLFTKLIDQTEDILAFMAHAEQSFDPDKKPLARQIRQRFSDQLETLLGDLHKAMADGMAHHSYILDTIATTIERGCLRFTVLEGTHWIDPDLIFDMMQNVSLS